eukprot:10173466-Alexandrium_andersonii.AAC.1
MRYTMTPFILFVGEFLRTCAAGGKTHILIEVARDGQDPLIPSLGKLWKASPGHGSHCSEP